MSDDAPQLNAADIDNGFKSSAAIFIRACASLPTAWGLRATLTRY